MPNEPTEAKRQEWQCAVLEGHTLLGLEEWLKEQSRLAAARPKRYRVTATVFLADGFDSVFEAKDEAEAKALARLWAEQAKWDCATINEVCFDSVEEEYSWIFETSSAR